MGVWVLEGDSLTFNSAISGSTGATLTVNEWGSK